MLQRSAGVLRSDEISPIVDTASGSGNDLARKLNTTLRIKEHFATADELVSVRPAPSLAAGPLPATYPRPGSAVRPRPWQNPIRFRYIIIFLHITLHNLGTF